MYILCVGRSGLSISCTNTCKGVIVNALESIVDVSKLKKQVLKPIPPEHAFFCCLSYEAESNTFSNGLLSFLLESNPQQHVGEKLFILPHPIPNCG